MEGWRAAEGEPSPRYIRRIGWLLRAICFASPSRLTQMRRPPCRSYLQWNTHTLTRFAGSQSEWIVPSGAKQRKESEVCYGRFDG